MRQDELRPALYHRFHALLPLLAMRRWWRAVLWTVGLLYFGFVLLVLVLRYSILPNIESYRGDIETLVSQGLGQAVSIGRIEASWAGVNPDLALFDVRIADAQGRPALAFARVETVLSWWSVPRLQLRLQLLQIDEPVLHLRRETDGRFFVAGLPLNPEGGESGAADWIFSQKHIRIRGATIVWEDALRGAPALVLEDVNFGLDNNGRRHRFGLTALPPPELAAKIDLRGDLRGRDFSLDYEQLESWKGQVYAEIDYADLAVWRQWIDYPVALPHGRGALRAWAGFADGALREMTADLALQDVSLRLASDLPALELERMAGRLAARFLPAGLEVRGQRVELVTRPLASEDGSAHAGLVIAPTDFQLLWQPEAEGKAVRGSATASQLDLEVLSALAQHLPLDAHSRQLLSDFSPRGRVSGLHADWRGDAERLQTYALQARFDDLALKAQGYFPGFSGLSGTLAANEKGGSATLLAQKSSLDLPSILPERLIALDTLSAQAKWKIGKGVLDAELSQVEFAGPAAAGTAQGTYRYSGDGPGRIDLTAALSRGDARAVWRFMPHAVNAGARRWVRDALTAGTASEAKLVLKGDLAHFPFVDKQHGQFLVTVKAHDVTLDYARGWPKITGIDGNLRFEGAGMNVDVKRGLILGAQVAQTQAEIPDFDAPLTMLKVKGRAEGATSEFLRFIAQSPVGERIDRFTEDMQASGNGRLDLGLVIPLEEARLGESKIDGVYHFQGNEVTVDPGLPPLQQVNGTLQFSEKDLRIPEINATLFGGPLKIKGNTLGEGKVLITANGSLSVAQLRKQADLPLFESLSGALTYRGEVRVRKRSADLTVESNLVGLASSLPEPFNKNAAAPLALRFEKTVLPAGTSQNGEALPRDQMRATLGSALALQLIRRKQADGFVTERGAIAVGRPLQLPERGVLLGITAPRIDADYWRQALRARPASNARESSASAAQPPLVSAISLKTEALDLFGRRYRDVDLNAAANAARWQIRLASREASGDLQWDGAGRGKLTARLKQLLLEPSSAIESSLPDDEAVEELPALDIVADDFSVGARRFGRLDLMAHNEGRVWRLDRIQLTNPHGKLTGSGKWQFGSGNRTQLDFKIESGDVGKLLDRLGYPGALRAGTALLAGKIGWSGPPVDLDYPTLSGEMLVEAGKGQFVKLDPGAGKLIGLISLQALPRRISLDFRDVFSEGFAFDSINGKLTLQDGLMHTDRLQIDGPAARVLMRGEADLKNETQRLEVNVQPDLGGSAALGVALVNPLAGVAALLAHKILQNPLNQIFGFDYLVTGKWDDPKVEKVSRIDPRQPNPANPTGANP
ncbi:MAG: YhdP family protein [Rhodocyclaceae bacterium]